MRFNQAWVDQSSTSCSRCALQLATMAPPAGRKAPERPGLHQGTLTHGDLLLHSPPMRFIFFQSPLAGDAAPLAGMRLVAAVPGHGSFPATTGCWAQGQLARAPPLTFLFVVAFDRAPTPRGRRPRRRRPVSRLDRLQAREDLAPRFEFLEELWWVEALHSSPKIA